MIRDFVCILLQAVFPFLLSQLLYRLIGMYPIHLFQIFKLLYEFELDGLFVLQLRCNELYIISHEQIIL